MASAMPKKSQRLAMLVIRKWWIGVRDMEVLGGRIPERTEVGQKRARMAPVMAAKGS